ncbi:hypothetical protein M413DRAFT_106463 [Hebeloma cylindrosporum]|uniref:Uncharacterized protein n=1 Tax=Hebeloma cylindrosporum TaxID=76867 RepID=A0A0C2YHW3_HEBCY|nr:hypothetical protein M413DRAFT_106463 [Hebeloma cylindrosporum h7]
MRRRAPVWFVWREIFFCLQAGAFSRYLLVFSELISCLFQPFFTSTSGQHPQHEDFVFKVNVG